MNSSAALKVLALTSDLSTSNGWGRVSFEILKRLSERGVQLGVFTSAADTELTQSSLKISGQLSSQPDSLLKSCHVFNDYRLIRKHFPKFDIVHSLVEPLVPLGAALCRANSKFVITAHGTYALSCFQGKQSWLYKCAWPRAHKIITVSRFTAQKLLEAMPSFRPKTEAVPLGVESPKLAAEQAAFQQNRPLAFMSVGALKPRKGVLLTIQALARVRTSFPEVKLYLVGSLSNLQYVNQVKELIKQHQLENNVELLGEISEEQIGELYKRVRALVMPSLNVKNGFEGFGLVHLEANAHGVLSIGSKNCGNEDAIQDGYSGFLVAQNDIDELSSTMIKVLEASFDWTRYSQQAYRFAQNMSWDRVADRYLSIYQNVLESKA